MLPSSQIFRACFLERDFSLHIICWQHWLSALYVHQQVTHLLLGKGKKVRQKHHKINALLFLNLIYFFFFTTHCSWNQWQTDSKARCWDKSISSCACCASCQGKSAVSTTLLPLKLVTFWVTQDITEVKKNSALNSRWYFCISAQTFFLNRERRGF